VNFIGSGGKTMIQFLFLLFFLYSLIETNPNPNILKKVYHISNAEGIKLTTQFPEYEDTVPYATYPNCLDAAHLLTINAAANWNDVQSYGIKNNKELYVAQINNAFISPTHLGTIFDYKQQLLFDFFIAPGYPIFWPVDGQINNARTLKYHKIATVQGPTFFYHWVIDRLPSVFLLKDLIVGNPDIKLLINSPHPASYVHEYLDLLGIPRSQQIVAQTNTIYQADTVYFATPFLMEPIPKKLLLALRKELLSAAKERHPSRQYNNNLIIVIQRRENNRRIQNLPELINMLKATFDHKGYETIVFDANMNISEQIILFNNARVVIGVMASGLTNILYTNPGTHVIEIRQDITIPGHGAEWCWWLASAIGLNYWAIPLTFNFSDMYITCPMDAVKTILKQLAL
jgi:hypothetical protein